VSTLGVANELIHEALHPYPDDLVLVSKVGAQRDGGEEGHRDRLRAERLQPG
jgi:aryl-alcohol dehydrogenase-like predicted oxidoreductase